MLTVPEIVINEAIAEAKSDSFLTDMDGSGGMDGFVLYQV